MRTAALVLAAGASSRFGSPKVLAPLRGRPLLEHTLEAVRAAGIEPVVVVLGHAADEIEAGVRWQGQIVVRNPDPSTLSSSLRVGMAAVRALEPAVEAALVVLGDQPRTRSDVIVRLVDAARAGERPVVVPRYAEGGGWNPVLVRRAAFPLVDEAAGDRGLGPVLATRPDLVLEVDVDGSNPDVDTPADLAALDWADRVRENREQVERVREVPDGADFYGPVSSLFRADPNRTDEPLLDALRALVEPGDVWLDIGAGAGRYALPIARLAREVIAVEPSAGMVAALREGAAAAGIGNVRVLAVRWPLPAEAPALVADVALIAHVGYDIEAIGPFLDAMEAAARRVCVAVLMERQPASAADPFWPRVHGEERAALPALPEFVALLRTRGREPEVRWFERQPRRFGSREELLGFLRRQLWIADGGQKERRFLAAFDELVDETADGWLLRDAPSLPIGLVTWRPFRTLSA